MEVFFNGRFLQEQQAVVPITDRSFLYGDGIFETLRVSHRRPFRWHEHLRRFEAAANYLQFPIPWPAEELRRFADQLLARNQLHEGLLRLTLSRGSGGRGYAVPAHVSPVLAISTHPLPLAPETLRLTVAKHRIALGNEPLTGWKTANKILSVLARLEAARAEVDDALVLNTDGRVAEASSSNVFWLEHGAVCTPPLSEGAMDGITRMVVLELCRLQNVRLHEKAIAPEELLKTDGVFLTNSGFGIVPVTAIDGSSLPASPFVTEMREAYRLMVHRETAG